MRAALVTALVLLLAGCGSPARPAPKHVPRVVITVKGQRATLTSAAAPVVGETLVGTTGTWSGNPTRFTYQWQDCAAGICTNINGATSSSYLVASSDIGDTLDLVVVAYGGAGGPMKFIDAVSPTATIAALNDQLTLTDVLTGS